MSMIQQSLCIWYFSSNLSLNSKQKINDSKIFQRVTLEVLIYIFFLKMISSQLVKSRKVVNYVLCILDTNFVSFKPAVLKVVD